MAPSPPHGDTHAWFRAHLDARALGLLDESEERRFLEHATSCVQCGAALKLYSENAARLAREGHIPAGILARWDRSRRKLRGLARRMVRSHLEQCVECRQDLETIGFEATLELLPGEEAEDPETAGVSWPGLHETPRRSVGPAHDWRPWVLGGALGAGLATAAAVLIVSTTRQGEPFSSVTGTIGGAPARPAAPAPPATRNAQPPGWLLPLPPPAPLRGTLRGGTPETTTLRVAPGTRFIHLEVPALYLPDSTTLDLRVIGPGGAELQRTRSRYEDLARRTLLLGGPADGLAAGEYRLLVSAPFAEPSAVGEFRFRVEAAGSR